MMNIHLRTVNILLLKESLLVLKKTLMGTWSGEPSHDEDSNIITPIKEKSGAPETCLLEVSPDVFKEICWCFP